MRDIIDMSEEYIKNIENDDYLKLLFNGLIEELKKERIENKKMELSSSEYKKERDNILKAFGIEEDQHYGRYSSII